MNLYTFIKKDGDVKRVGGQSSVSEELQAIFRPWSEAGWVPAAAEEWDAQVIKPCGQEVKSESASVSE